MYVKLLKEMFAEMVIKKNASLIPHYYHKDFLLITNGIEMDFEQFLKDHETYYQTSIQYQVKYQEETFIEEGEKIAGRVFITVTTPDEPPKEIEVLLIASYKDQKIHRLWELTFPDWSKLETFEEMP